MHPPTHALIGWGVANLVPDLDRRSRATIFFASVIPDLDGVTYVFSHDLYERFHRTLCHNFAFAAVCIVAGALLAASGRRAVVALLVAVNFHLHLLCDYLGSAAPDGSIWGIPYLQPLSDASWRNPWQWGLRSWQNLVITLAALGWAVWIARRHGRSPVEPFSRRGDAAVVEVVRRRLGWSS